MANEVLTRTPTSTGNRKKFTWAGWIKRNDIDASGGNSYQGIFAVGTADGAEDTFMFSSDQIRLRCESGSDVTTSQKYRDSGNWMHVMMVVDTTLYDPDHRCIFYVNGVKSDVMTQESDITQNANLRINSVDKHYLGEFPRINNHLDGQIFDVFLVDGQALTPDVFGFYKDGDGYMSSGTSQTTDFRPGQWMPHTPTKIKKDINRRGGFGVNGFYLPMNDSSNPGADFHCNPNSIITLKGEDLPQPRNGAPTTSDAYVSQLRTHTGGLFNDGVVNFNGSGERNALQDSGNAVNLGTGAFTVEAFVYHSNLPQNALQYIFMNTAQQTTNTFAFAVESDRIIAGIYASSFSNSTKVEATFPVGSLKTGQWYHYAACRSGNTLRLFINGKMMVEDTSHTENYNNTSAFGCRVGCEAGAGATVAGYKAIRGFISNVRVVNGTALYTSNFTPPTEPLTNVTNTVLLCCQSPTSATAAAVSPGTLSLLTETGDRAAFAARNELDASIVLACPFVSGGLGQNGAANSTIPGLGDYHIALGGPSSIPAVNFLIASGNQAQITGDNGLYYGSSLDVTTSSINPRATVGTAFTPDGDYTVEFWCYINSFNSGGSHIVQYDTNAGQTGWLVSFDSGNLRWMLRNSSNQDVQVSVANVVKAQQWNHFAGVYNSSRNTMTAYLNGVAVGTTTVAYDYLSTQYTNLNRIHIGSNVGNGSRPMQGYLQDLRIYKGLAKYKGGFDVSKPYAPVGIEAFRTTADTCKNNFATYNPLRKSSNQTLSDGNLTCTQSGSVWGAASSTIGMDESSGKYYVEYRVGGTQYSYIGIANVDSLVFDLATVASGYSFLGGTANDWGYLSSNGYLRHNDGVAQTGGAVLSAGDILGITFDTSNKEAKWYKNGALQYTQTLTGNYPFFFAGGSYQSSNAVNFGQNPSFSGTTTAGTNADGNGKGLFKYAPPSGFLALCEDNLPAPAIVDPGKHFKTVLWTGDGNAGRGITGLGFKPDFVWIKDRGDTSSHSLFDSVRGAGIWLGSNSTSAEQTAYVNVYNPSFNNDGFGVGTDGAVNGSGSPYVAWCWKAGGAVVPNTDGSITSQVSVNQDAGFSIVSFTGNASNSTVGHGLGKIPKIIIHRNLDATGDWYVYHSYLGATKNLRLNQTAAQITTSNLYNNTEPTSSTFALGTSGGSNSNNEKYIAYCWAEIEGFSKFGSFEGNDSTDGTFVYLGFKPALVIAKQIDTVHTVGGSAATSWGMWDSSRMPNNPAGNPLWANLNSTETIRGNGSSANTGGSDGNGLGGFLMCDLLSNGFKARSAGSEFNAAGTHIYMAWAESPFQTANAK